MSASNLDIFYNIFWQDKACQNLFMLSKNELLDTKTFELEGNRSYFSLPRIIISNVSSDDDNKDVLKFRTESHSLEKEGLIDNAISFYEPIVAQFLETTFGKAYKKFMVDFEKDPMSFLVKNAVKIFFAKDPENEALNLLQNYGFVPKHLKSFKELEAFATKEGISKNYKKVVNEENYRMLHDVLRSVKDLYLNLNFQGLYESNQILVNSLYDSDNFKSRIKLFSILYDHDIIQDSGEDCFVECTNCKPGTYKGTLHLKINPKNLSKLKCIHCNEELTYYMPYSLSDKIFEKVNAKDGLISDVFEELCHTSEISYKLNVNLLNDIEIDGLFEMDGSSYMVEMKMYEHRAGMKKIESKIKKHVQKLCDDLNRLRKDAKSKKRQHLFPILLVNILDDQWLEELENEIHRSGDDIVKECRVMNVNTFKRFIEQN
jgi:hypothetical protein